MEKSSNSATIKASSQNCVLLPASKVLGVNLHSQPIPCRGSCLALSGQSPKAQRKASGISQGVWHSAVSDILVPSAGLQKQALGMSYWSLGNWQGPVWSLTGPQKKERCSSQAALFEKFSLFHFECPPSPLSLLQPLLPPKSRNQAGKTGSAREKSQVWGRSAEKQRLREMYRTAKGIPLTPGGPTA